MQLVFLHSVGLQHQKLSVAAGAASDQELKPLSPTWESTACWAPEKGDQASPNRSSCRGSPGPGRDLEKLTLRFPVLRINKGKVPQPFADF